MGGQFPRNLDWSHHWSRVLPLKGWFSNRTGTPVDDGKARGKDWTLLPVPNLPLCDWSSQLVDLRAQSSTDVPVLLLNQPIDNYSYWDKLLLTNNKKKWFEINWRNITMKVLYSSLNPSTFDGRWEGNNRFRYMSNSLRPTSQQIRYILLPVNHWKYSLHSSRKKKLISEFQNPNNFQLFSH